jgi:hypothetical protein
MTVEVNGTKVTRRDLVEWAQRSVEGSFQVKCGELKLEMGAVPSIEGEYRGGPRSISAEWPVTFRDASGRVRQVRMKFDLKRRSARTG